VIISGSGRSDLMTCNVGTNNQQNREIWLEETLERASRKDQRSKELLNFGFHVHAVKER
jgi:hypothetical protein